MRPHVSYCAGCQLWHVDIGVGYMLNDYTWQGALAAALALIEWAREYAAQGNADQAQHWTKDSILAHAYAAGTVPTQADFGLVK